jgi:DNA-binding NarL/FixJ family response regulator
MGARRFRILVAERNRMMAEAIRDVFVEATGDDQVSIANSLAAALLLAQRTTPDLMVLDIWLGGRSLEDALRQLKECSPRSVIIVAASHVDADLERRVLQAAGMGCVEKERLPAMAAGIIERLGAAR